MSPRHTRWVRREPEGRERLITAGMAAAAGLAVGAVTLYLARMFVARERIDPPPPPTPVDGERTGPGVA